MIKVCRGRDGSGARRIIFSLSNDAPSGRVSVVGSFNGWTPGHHDLQPRANGRRSAIVEVAAGVPVRFRYLGENGHWFDDPDDPHVLDRIAAQS